MADDEKDPFEVFNHSTGSGLVRNPYPRFAELRAQCPVHEGTAGKVFRIPLIDHAAFSPTRHYYTACSFAPVAVGLLARATVSSSRDAPTQGLLLGDPHLE